MPFRVHRLYVRRPPESGRTPDDVPAYLSLSAADIVRAGMALTRNDQR